MYKCGVKFKQLRMLKSGEELNEITSFSHKMSLKMFWGDRVYKSCKDLHNLCASGCRARTNYTNNSQDQQLNM